MDRLRVLNRPGVPQSWLLFLVLRIVVFNDTVSRTPRCHASPPFDVCFGCISICFSFAPLIHVLEDLGRQEALNSQ